MARARGSELKDQRSSRLPPPRVRTTRSVCGTWLARARPATSSATAPSPWTREGAIRISQEGQRRPAIWRKSRIAAPGGW